jgi:tetratricopeptide (TPR) repeat protein
MSRLLQINSSGRISRSASFWLVGLACLMVAIAIGTTVVRWHARRVLERAAAALEKKNYNQALTTISGYLRSHPRDERALDIKAQTLAALGFWDKALQIYDSQGAESSASVRVWARALARAKRWDDALKQFERLRPLASADPEIWYQLSYCYQKLEHFDDAERAAEELAAIQGQEARGQLMLALLNNDRKNYQRAAAACGQLLERVPDGEGLFLPSERVLLECGVAFLGAGKLPEAVDCLRRSVETNPTVEAKNKLASAYELSGDVPRAVALWRSVVSENSTDVAARVGLARAALQDGVPADALDWLRPLASRPGGMTSPSAYLLERAYTNLGDKQQALYWRGRAQELREREQRLDLIEYERRFSPGKHK